MKSIAKAKKDERGAVSLFVVIFSSLLVTIVTMSFVQIMVRHQQQAASVDQSQSAYDSALSGVEDAKRALLAVQAACGSDGEASDCTAKSGHIDGNDCHGVQHILGMDASGEAVIEQSEDDKALNQAYTCVKVDRTPSSIPITGLDTAIELVPLKGTSSFNKLNISWGLSDSDDSPLSLNSESTLPNEWAEDTPALLRIQAIQYDADGFSLSDFDDTDSDGPAFSRVVYLRPSLAGGDVDLNSVRHGLTYNEPKTVECDPNGGVGACNVDVLFPDPAAGDEPQRFLLISALYNRADVTLRLQNDTDAVEFADGIAATVDSTGRTGTMFRRVEATVRYGSAQMPYPMSALDVAGNLCKNFEVTSNVTGYHNYANLPGAPQNCLP